jgi:2,3-bisphosphoglycerate-independent phosphoglycerate mutase
MQKVLLLILDGWGYSKQKKGNAMLAAQTPCFNSLISKYPHSFLNASGPLVGLPEGIMGNSEVGHENIGAGRINDQKLTQISKMVQTGDFFKNQVLVNAVEHAKAHNSKLHFMGLISEGDVHSHIGHLKALIELARRLGLDHTKIKLHAISDGRDDPPKVSSKLMEKLATEIDIATVSGRFWAMDRDKNWDRVDKYFKVVTEGSSLTAKTAKDAILNYYNYADANQERVIGNTDEFVEPTLIQESGLIEEKDSVIFFNFRPDRATEISTKFKTYQESHPDLLYTCFTEYDSSLNLPVAFDEKSLPEQNYSNSLGEYISNLGLNQFRIAETEKFAHVTVFFNGRKKEPFAHEDRLLVPSPKVATYDLKPEMSVAEVTDGLIKAIENKEKDYKLIVCNFANPDMVGHTGNWEAVIKALEIVDSKVSLVKAACEANDYKLIITADHGNADQMLDDDGTIRTAHSCNLVPLILVDKNYQLKDNIDNQNSLSNIAPTILDIMGLEKPDEMTSTSLLIKQSSFV